jgi:hypothetical protein
MMLYKGMLGRRETEVLCTKSTQLRFNRKMRGKIIRCSGKGKVKLSLCLTN